MSDYHAAYYQDNRDRLLARARANYLAKREAKLAAAKQRRETNPEYQRTYMETWSGLKQYNITPEQRAELIETQNDICPGCQTVLSELDRAQTATDHDHTCCAQKSRSCGQCVRGILCQTCNKLLGLAKDNPETLRRLAEYLDRGPYQW